MSTTQLVYLLPLAGLWSLAGWPEPITMIAIAVTIFVAIKVHSLILFIEKQRQSGDPDDSNGKPISFSSLVVWFCVWWGLKPTAFFKKQTPEPLRIDTLAYIVLKILLGVAILTVIAPALLRDSPPASTQAIVAGWIGMVGIVFCMHFGYSHLSAVVLRSSGRPVSPIMHAPILATSVSEFWGKRWNLAFRDYAHSTLFLPLARRWGGSVGVIAGFVFSGIVHELAISIPAKGGYGWPTAYFLLQGLGVFAERRMKAAKWFRDGSIAGRAFAIGVVAILAPMLFHQAFVTRVINPILTWCDVTAYLS